MQRKSARSHITPSSLMQPSNSHAQVRFFFFILFIITFHEFIDKPVSAFNRHNLTYFSKNDTKISNQELLPSHYTKLQGAFHLLRP